MEIMQKYWRKYSELERVSDRGNHTVLSIGNDFPSANSAAFISSAAAVFLDAKRTSQSINDIISIQAKGPNDFDVVQAKKRSSSEVNNLTTNEEPTAKKLLLTNNSKSINSSISITNGKEKSRNIAAVKYFETPKQDVSKVNQPKSVSILKPMRCISGDVAQIFNFNKAHHALYEVYAKIFQIKNGRTALEKCILLRNDAGPILQGIFYEIDFKMTNVKAGDAVRCVGKFVNNSRMQIFKISPITENSPQLVSRLHSIALFVIGETD